jgi:hypothetical protein
MQKFIRLLMILLLSSSMSSAQKIHSSVNTQPIMDQHGKIYVVMLVCLVVLGGLISYLFILDRHIAKLENEKKTH